MKNKQLFGLFFSLLQGLQKIMVEGDGDGLHSVFQFIFGQVALPDYYNLPAVLQQNVIILLVTPSVVLYFCPPEVGIAFGHHKFGAALMSVPKTTVDEDGGSVSAHHNVRFAGDASDIESITVSVRP